MEQGRSDLALPSRDCSVSRFRNPPRPRRLIVMNASGHPVSEALDPRDRRRHPAPRWLGGAERNVYSFVTNGENADRLIAAPRPQERAATRGHRIFLLPKQYMANK